MPCHYTWRAGKYIAMVVGDRDADLARDGIAMAAKYRKTDEVVARLHGRWRDERQTTSTAV